MLPGRARGARIASISAPGRNDRIAITGRRATRDNQRGTGNRYCGLVKSVIVNATEQTDGNRNNIFLQLLLKMPKPKPEQLTRNQQRELDRKRKAKREKANVKKSKQRLRLTEDVKGLQREKNRVRMNSRSRERRSGTPEEKAQLLEQYRALKEPHLAKIRASKKEAEEARCALTCCVPVVQTEILQTEMLPPEMSAEKKDPAVGYPKPSQVGLPQATPPPSINSKQPEPGSKSHSSFVETEERWIRRCFDAKVSYIHPEPNEDAKASERRRDTMRKHIKKAKVGLDSLSILPFMTLMNQPILTHCVNRILRRWFPGDHQL